MPTLLSIQVGQPQDYTMPDGEVWRTSIFKTPITGPVKLNGTNLVGDAQADLKHHGGVDKAANVFPSEHYPYWREKLGLPDMPYGGFGENLTIAGLLEGEVAIGDTFRIGTATVQVSQPRQPCWKLARRWGVKDLAVQVQNIGSTGWYFRVLEEGIVDVGQDFELIDHPYPQWTITEANRLMHHDKNDWEALAGLRACPMLGVSWKKTFQERLDKREVIVDSGARLFGE